MERIETLNLAHNWASTPSNITDELCGGDRAGVVRKQRINSCQQKITKSMNLVE